MSLQTTLDFLAALSENNNRDWFTANRSQYEAAQAAFEAFIADLIGRFDAVEELGPLTPKDAMFRINRDVRFSKDKSPYKDQMTALLARGGRKSGGRGYYVCVAPRDGSFVATGIIDLQPDELAAIRTEIAADASPLRDILAAESFQRYFAGLTGEQVKSAPKGYAKDHPDIDLLRHKEFMIKHPIDDDDLVKDGITDRVIAAFAEAKAFATYFHDILGERAQHDRS